MGSYFFESFVVMRLPTTVPIAVGSVRRRFFDEPTVIAIEKSNYKKPLAVGYEAEKLQGKSGENVKFLRLENSDFYGRLATKLNDKGKW